MYKYLLPLFLLSACSSDRVNIDYHGGGVIYKTMDEIKHYKKPIYVRGICGSSCTYVFHFEDTCVADDARIMFHAPRNDDQSINPDWFKIMADWYPKNLKDWFLETAKDGEDHWFDGKEFKQKFKIGECND